VPTEMFTKHEPLASERIATTVDPKGDRLRGMAIERIHRLRRFKIHLVAFALGVPLLGGIWVLTEYYEEHTWPSRFVSAPDVAGTWDPWFFFVAGIWALILVSHALRTYFGPPLGRSGGTSAAPCRGMSSSARSSGSAAAPGASGMRAETLTEP
jgi:hypothetical protein